MQERIFEIKSNACIAKLTYKMELCGDTDAISAPGQFVNIKLDGLFLRRPISVCRKDGDTLTIAYKVVGKGTEQMSKLLPGTKLDLLTGLGNGYSLDECGENPVVIGGGAGVPPMLWLCEKLCEKGVSPVAILGFNSKDEVFFEDEFKQFCKRVYIATADGSCGEKGFVTDVMKTLDYSYFYTCGPMPMFRAINAIAKTSGQLSFEERMGCGFGACMGCSCKTLTGNKRICKDGPVMRREEIIW